MASIRRRMPSYRLHKSSGQARVIICGQHHYLGLYGSEESWEKYRRLVAELNISPIPNHHSGNKVFGSSRFTIDELILAYWHHAKEYYVKNGKPTDEQHCIRLALRQLRKLYSTTEAGEFGPKALKAVRKRMIDADYSRKTICDSISRIRRMFKWAASEEILSVSVFQSLTTIEPLKKGRSGARETEPVRAVSAENVQATLPFLLPYVAAMVQIQELAGMRPQDIRNLRTSDLDTTGEVWIYTPHTHKTEYLGLKRRIAIGPHAQSILASYLKPLAPNEYVFSPKEAVNVLRRAEPGDNRPKIKPCHPAKRGKNTSRTPGSQYGKRSYEVAIARACKKAGVEHWTPNQLRHSCAVRIRTKYGAEAAAAVLGNSLGMVVEVYAESNFELAKRVMLEIG